MNAHKALLKSGLDAAGNPPLVSKVYHPMEHDPLKVYTARLATETADRLNTLKYNFTSIQDFVPMLESEEGVVLELDEKNKKHAGSMVRATRKGFEVRVGAEWRRIVSTCQVIGVPLGIGKLHIQFTLNRGKDGNYIKVL